MVKSLLLFDIDGTLISTSGAGMRAMHRVGQQLFGQAFTLEGVQVSGHLDPLIFAEATVHHRLEDDSSDHETFRDRYLVELSLELAANREAVRSANGVQELLQVLRKRAICQQDVVLGLLTGNYTLAVPIKLAAVGIDPDWFPITAFGDEAASRSDLVLLAMKKYRKVFHDSIPSDRVIVIGDTPRDIDCAHAHGCVAYAVATGRFSVEELSDSGADMVAQDLSDPTPLIQWIDSITT